MGAAGAFMGGLGQLMGGNSQSDGSTSSNTTGSSSNQSQNSSLQASQSNSGSVSSNRSGANNQAYGAINSALNPSLGYVTSAGNMMAALLGLSPSTTPYDSPAVSPLPTAEVAPHSPVNSTSATAATINALLNKYATAVPPSVPVVHSPTPTLVPPPNPAPTPAPVPAPSGGYSGYGGSSSYNGAPHAAQGGAVHAHKPVIVGEHQPEVFVPKTDGMILPQVPGMGPDGRNAPPGSPPSGSNLDLLLHMLEIPHRAMGGPVQAGSPVMVGENQPETFVPNGRPTMTTGMVPNVPGSVGLNPGMGGPIQGQQSLLTSMFSKGGFGRGGFGHSPPVPVGTPPPGSVPLPSPPPPSSPPAPSIPAAPPPPDAAGALNSFANSAGEQFLLNQGQRAISGASAGNGTFDSGSTGQALEQFGQNLGNTYLNDYINHLSQYAQMGLGSASAMTGAGGVSQSTGGTTSNAGSTSIGTSQGTASGSSSNNSNSSGSTNSSSKQGLGI